MEKLTDRHPVLSKRLCFSLCALLALSGCYSFNSVKRGGSSTGYYTDLIMVSEAPSLPPVSSLAVTPRYTSPLQAFPFADKSLEDLGVPVAHINIIDAIKLSGDDSYLETLRVMTAVKSVLDDLAREDNIRRFGDDQSRWPSPETLQNRPGIGIVSNQQLYAIIGASMIRRIGMSPQLAMVKRAHHQTEGIIAIGETLAIDLLEPAVQSVGAYRITRMSQTDLNQPWTIHN